MPRFYFNLCPSAPLVFFPLYFSSISGEIGVLSLLIQLFGKKVGGATTLRNCSFFLLLNIDVVTSAESIPSKSETIEFC